MSIQSIIAFNSAVDKMKENENNAVSIQTKRAELKQKQEAWDIDKQARELDLKNAELTSTLLPYQVEQQKKMMNEQNSLTKKGFDLHEQMLNMTEADTHKQMQDAAKTATMLHASDPDVQNHVGTLSAIMGNKNALPSQAPGIADAFPSISPQPKQPAQPSSAGAPAPAQPMQSSPMPQEQPTATAQSTSTPAPSNKPPLAQVYGQLSTEPFGSRNSDIYMSNPNTMEAIKSGQYLVKKDPSMIQAENPLFLNDKDKQILNDADELINKMGYDKKEVLNTMSPGLRDMITKVGTYSVKPVDLTSAMGGGRQRQEIVKAVTAFYPKYREQKYNQVNTYMGQLAEQGGVGGRIISINTVGPHLVELKRLSEEVKNGNFTPANAVINYVQTVLGKPEVTNFNGAKEVITNEIENVLSQKGATQSGVKRMEDLLNKNMSPDQFAGFTRNMAQLIAERIQPYREQYKQIMDEDEGGVIVHKSTKEALQSILGKDPFKDFDSGRKKSSFALEPHEDIGAKNTAFMEKAKKAGYSEEEIQAYLSGGGNIEQ